MILFLDDWKKYPHAIVDYDTRNTSFLRQAQVYKSMGIRNHAFLLALLNPAIKGWNPHDPNLTLEQKVMIGIECRFNPWYYFREVVRLPPQGGLEPVQFRANRGNIALFWSFFNNIDSALIQPRQTGKSASTDCLMDWLIYIGARNSRIMLLTKDDSLRRANVDRLKGIRDLLPKYLINISKDDADNQFELTCQFYGNRYSTSVAQNSEANALNLGRGLTAPILHCDEGPFISHIGVSLPAALAAATAAREEAARNGQPYGNIFTTTAGKKDDRDGRFMYELIHSGAVWNEVFFDAPNRTVLRQMVKENGSGGAALVNITMSHRQLGRTDEWLREAIANSRATGEAADRDFLNIWTSGTQRSPLSTQLNEVIRKSEKEVLYSEINDRYILRWYIPEEEISQRMSEGHYVVGLDTSEAVGRDTIALVMVDIRDLSVVAAGTYNETNLIRFSAYLLGLMVKYQNTTFIVERKSTGAMILDYLILKLTAMGIDPFRRLFNRLVDEGKDQDEHMRELQRRPEFRSEIFYDQHKSSFGFQTTKESRTVLYTTVLQNAAKKAGHLVHDKTLSTEIRGLVEKNGRIDHAASGHDDMVIAWLLCHWFLSHGRNLSFYGINHTQVMVEVSEMGRQLTDEELMERERQYRILDEIDDLLEKLKECRDDVLNLKYEHRLRHLQNQLSNSTLEEVNGLDALIQQAKEERQKRLRMDQQNRRAGHSPNGHREINRPIQRIPFLGTTPSTTIVY